MHKKYFYTYIIHSYIKFNLEFCTIHCR